METGNIVRTDIPLIQQPVMDPLCKELSEVLIDDSTITVVKSLWTLLSPSVQDTERIIILDSNTHLYFMCWNMLHHPHSVKALNCLTSICLVLRKCSGLYSPVILRCQSFDGAFDCKRSPGDL